MSNLPAHHQHQAQPEQQEAQAGKAVLNANDLVVGGKNVFAHEANVFMVLFVRADVRHGMRCCLHFSFLIVRSIARGHFAPSDARN
jgi:hypothetical protein